MFDNMKNFHIASNSRFTEEVLFDGELEEETDFDISLDKDCTSNRHKPEDYVNDTQLCYHCYYGELAEKMIDGLKIRPSKRLDFVRHQMDLRDDPLTFLEELEELVVDNEVYFDDADYGLQQKYLAIIKALRDRINTPFKDKVKAALRLLQLNRGEPENHSLSYLLENSGYKLVADDEILIAQALEEKGLITYVGSKDDVFAMLTPKGVTDVDGESLKDSVVGLNSVDLLEAITEYLDLKFANTDVLVAQTGKELADIIEELNEKVGGGAKKSIGKLVRAKLSEIILTETLKRGAIHPALDWAERIIEELPSG